MLHQRRIETPSPSELLGELFRSQEAYKNYGQYTESLKQYKDLLVRVGNQEKRIGEIDVERKIAEYRNRMFAMEAKELRTIVEKETRRAVAETQRRDYEKYAQRSKERTERLSKREYIAYRT